MGGLFSKFKKQKKVKILMLGLDGSGKTTILYKLKLGDVVSTIPTIGFNTEAVEYKNVKFTVWDIGGQDKLRELWKHYYNDVDGIIFVIDSADIERLDIVKQELRKLMDTYELRKSKFLIFGNKYDQPNSLSAKKIIDKIGLHSSGQQKTHIISTCARTGEGLYEGLDWLVREINKDGKKKYGKKNRKRR